MSLLVFYLIIFLGVSIFRNYIFCLFLTIITGFIAFYFSMYPMTIGHILWAAFFFQLVSTIIMFIAKLNTKQNKQFLLYLVKALLLLSFSCFVFFEDFYLSTLNETTLLYKYQFLITYAFSLTFGIVTGLPIFKGLSNIVGVNKNMVCFSVLPLLLLAIIYNIVDIAAYLSYDSNLPLYLIFSGIGFMISTSIIVKEEDLS